MAVWVAVVAKDAVAGEISDRWVRARAAQALPDESLGGPPASWSSPSGRVRFHRWDIHDERRPIGHPSRTTDHTVRAVMTSGFVQDLGEPIDDDALGERLRRSGSDSVWSLGGIHAGCWCDRDDQVHAWSSRGRLESVFHAAGPDVHVVSNRPFLAHQVARRRDDVGYDESFGVHVLGAGLPVGTRTPFAGVEHLPDTTELVVGRRGASMRRMADERQLPPNVDYAEPLLEALVHSVRPLGRSPLPVQLSLTGGKDSRLIAALLVRAGVDFTSATIGFPDHPDVIGAASVARLLGVDHSIVPPAGGSESNEIDLGRRVLDIVRGADGMLTPYDNPGPRRSGPREQQTIGGAGGEVLRGGLATATDPTPEQRTNRITWQLLQNERFLTPEAVATQRSLLDGWLAANDDLSPAHALSWYHREIRLGRWNMAGRLLGRGSSIVQPFLDSMAIRRSVEAPLAERSSERAFFTLLRRLDLRLAELPLTTSTWRFERRTSAATPTAPYSWRTNLSGPVGLELAEWILASPARDRLFAVVDRTRFESFLGRVRAGSVDGKESPSRFLWAAAGLVTLWSDDWRRDLPEDVGPVVDISPPTDRPATDTP